MYPTFVIIKCISYFVIFTLKNFSIIIIIVLLVTEKRKTWFQLL